MGDFAETFGKASELVAAEQFPERYRPVANMVLKNIDGAGDSWKSATQGRIEKAIQHNTPKGNEPSLDAPQVLALAALDSAKGWGGSEAGIMGNVVGSIEGFNMRKRLREGSSYSEALGTQEPRRG